MAALQIGCTYISARRQDRHEILTAKPMFSGYSFTMRLMVMLFDQTEVGNSIWWPLYFKLYLSQLQDEIQTNFNGYT